MSTEKLPVLRLSFWLAAVLFTVMSLALGLLLGLRPYVPQPLLAFSRVEERNLQLWLHDLSRGSELRLPHTLGAINPAWSPDGRWLAYIERVPGAALGNVRLYALESGLNYFLGETPILSAPVWSPDGRWLMFRDEVEQFTGDQPFLGLSFAEVLPDRVGAVRTIPFPIANFHWSPDGRTLVYSAAASDNALMLLPAECLESQSCGDATHPSIQTDYPVADIVDWLDGGQGLLVTAFLPAEETTGLYQLDMATGEMTLLLKAPLPGVLPGLSPDGAMLAVSLAQVGAITTIPDAAERTGLFLIELESGEQRQIYRGIAAQLGWTPASDRLVFEAVEMTLAGGTRQISGRAIYVYNRARGDVTRLTAHGVIEATPVWGIYQGRSFAGWPVFLLNGILLTLLVGCAARQAPLRPGCTSERE